MNSGDIQRIDTVSGGQVAQNLNGDMVGRDKVDGTVFNQHNVNIHTQKTFKITFEYSYNLKKILNLQDIYNSFLDYSTSKSKKEIEVKVKCENLDKTKKIKAKQLILERISNLDFSKTVSKSVILNIFDNLEIVVFDDCKINKTGWETLKITGAVKKECYKKFIEYSDFDIGDLIEEYQDIDFSIDDKIYYNIVEFLNYKIEEIKKVLNLMKKNEIPSTKYQIEEFEKHIIELKKLQKFYVLFEDEELYIRFYRHIALLFSVRGALDFEKIIDLFQNWYQAKELIGNFEEI